MCIIFTYMCVNIYTCVSKQLCMYTLLVHIYTYIYIYIYMYMYIYIYIYTFSDRTNAVFFPVFYFCAAPPPWNFVNTHQPPFSILFFSRARFSFYMYIHIQKCITSIISIFLSRVAILSCVDRYVLIYTHTHTHTHTHTTAFCFIFLSCAVYICARFLWFAGGKDPCLATFACSSKHSVCSSRQRPAFAPAHCTLPPASRFERKGIFTHTHTHTRILTHSHMQVVELRLERLGKTDTRGSVSLKTHDGNVSGMTHTHTHTHIHTYTHTHTHTHTHTRAYSLSKHTTAMYRV